jgi:TonB family protein
VDIIVTGPNPSPFAATTRVAIIARAIAAIRPALACSVGAAVQTACILGAPPAPAAEPPSRVVPSDAPAPAASTGSGATRAAPVTTTAVARATSTRTERGPHRKHRFVLSDATRWKGALDGYVSAIDPAREDAPHEVQSESYLNAMHLRIHEIFSDGLLESLDERPRSDPSNDDSLVAEIEIVVSRDGHLRQLGIVRSSGVIPFDIGVLDSVDRAQPFDPPPAAIVSFDDNVYIRWEFHRSEVFACSTHGVRIVRLSAGRSAPVSL